MKIWKIIFFLSLFISCFSSASLHTDAESIATENSVSNVTINIIEKTLELTKVDVPIFENHTLSGSSFVLQPKNSIDIQVKDTRIGRRSPWSIYYKVSLFATKNDDIISNQKLSLGKGTISTINSEGYEATSIDRVSNVLHPMVIVTDTSLNEYTYTIPKTAISLELGSDTKAGSYTAKQTVILTSLPESQ